MERSETLRIWASRYARLVLARCDGNKRAASRALGISYHTLQAYLRVPLGGDSLEKEGNEPIEQELCVPGVSG
jgi:hypothetical protein